MTIYTGTGDHGQTSLFSGERVPKNHRRIEACGEVDELNSILGLLVSRLGPEEEGWVRELRAVQARLFDLGAWLSTTGGSESARFLSKITPETSRALEERMDRMEETLPGLTSFILPGGHELAAWAHLARAVCRRVERRVVALASPREQASEVPSGVLVYLNRLSDYLFVLARSLNQRHGQEDVPWSGRGG